MEIIPAARYPAKDRSSLIAFLRYCRDQARRENRRKYASITLRVPHIDPLAVLTSIYEPRELHAYFEHPEHAEALAGADAIVFAKFTGMERFAQARAWAEEVGNDCIAIGDMDAPMAGPRFLFAFGFWPQEEEDSPPFPPGLVFLPRWQVGCADGVHSATANLPIDPESPVEPMADRVLAAHARFHAFPYRTAQPVPPVVVEHREEWGGDEHFQEGVANALRRISSGEFAKIVLARAIDLRAAQPLRPLACVHRLRERFPGCRSFSLGNGDGVGFIGATPERLVRLENGLVETEAVAGSAPRGSDAGEDARIAHELLTSEKDLREHRHVIQSICRRLAVLGVEAKAADFPSLMQLANVRHLRSPIHGVLPEGSHLFSFLASLHPTPAVGGTPREPALAAIPGLEGFPRGLYAGVVGWCDTSGMGEGIVAIRSALVRENWARIYAGAGIVAGSDPSRELAETEIKFQALLGALLV